MEKLDNFYSKNKSKIVDFFHKGAVMEAHKDEVKRANGRKT